MTTMIAAARMISWGFMGQGARRRWCRGDLPDLDAFSKPCRPVMQAPLSRRSLSLICSLSSERPPRSVIPKDATKKGKRSDLACRSSLHDVREFEVSERHVLGAARRSSQRSNATTFQGFFEADAASGRVECTSRGCRPIYEDSLQLDENVRWSAPKSRPATHEFSTIPPHLLSDFFTVDITNELKEAFEAALQEAPCNAQLLSEFAGFTWEAMRDPDAADRLYNQALDVSPDDPDLLASHALFLWRSDQ
ncbi:uncharacterized protein [Physcomitrium patens]|uniref:Uncharacterized protein n=1 Tax=Physcomitrium patens TaxID=3218 RepID=A0A2K1ICQ4_PHYPA|nr:uncharacterized protein LOC112277745 [Physcomitrium patens]PNR27054.1 hypothetical protein PHYPA_030535 [Physcomitrium patens]|eukprot:XP_024366202.1 uncharacterized protein LOC112277745 [Physcomitrella patens]